MRVLITGAKGFIGNWVIRELDSTEHTAIDFSGDIRDKSTFPKGPIAVIIHLAALITHRHLYTSEDLYRVNVEGTKNLLESYPEAKMVFISTRDVICEELSAYAETKLEAEAWVQAKGNCVIIRLPSVFGPEQRQVKLIPLLFRKYCQGGSCTINNNNTGEYIYVEDVARQIISNMKKTGIITLVGFKIRNLDLDAMIRAVCRGDDISGRTSEEKEFFRRLQQCLSSYKKRTV